VAPALAYAAARQEFVAEIARHAGGIVMVLEC